MATLIAIVPRSTQAADELPPIVFVARGHLATKDFVFPKDDGPAGQLTSGLAKFAPGSRLLIRNPDGTLRTLVDTTRPAGDPLNPLGLLDVQSPDVSFDATRIVFSGSMGPTIARDGRPYFSWRLYEIGVNGQGLHQVTFSDRQITIPGADDQDTLGNVRTYSYYNDLFPAYLADGRIVFSSSRYPSRAHYDQRITYNLYVVNSDGSGLRRITTERGSALHPTPLPDGRILFSRWWVNFNQPSERDIYNMIDNRAGTEPVLDEQGNQVRGQRGNPVTGYKLPDGTMVYSRTDKIEPAQGRLPGGALIPRAPDTWHLMTVNSDGSAMQRYAWTPRYPYHLTTANGNDSFAAAQPTLIISGTETIVAYTTQRDGTMSHSTHDTGIRVAWPGLEQMYRNTTESIAGYRWGPNHASPVPPYALHPAGLPDGRILFSQTFTDTTVPSTGTYTFTEGGRPYSLPLQGSSSLRYELRTMQPDGSDSQVVPLVGGIGTADAMDAKPIVVRHIGGGPGDWRAQMPRLNAPISDDPLQGNVPRGLLTHDGQPAFPWSIRSRSEIALTTFRNTNVYANPGLDKPYINNSPPIGSASFADIYIDANQFTGIWPEAPDTMVRAIKWATVPVDAQGGFTAQVPADTPIFVVLRTQNRLLVRAGNRSEHGIAQGNVTGRPGEMVGCVGCHMGHASGSLDGEVLASEGWTNIAPSATVRVSSAWGADTTAIRINDRRNYVPAPAPASGFQDTTGPWIASRGRAQGESVQLDWRLPVIVRELRLVGAQPGYNDLSSDFRVSGQLQFFLGDKEISTARRQVDSIATLDQGGSRVTLDQTLVVDRVVFTVTEVTGSHLGSPTAALAEVEVIGQKFTPEARYRIRLPLVRGAP